VKLFLLLMSMSTYTLLMYVHLHWHTFLSVNFSYWFTKAGVALQALPGVSFCKNQAAEYNYCTSAS
jgi:hypothetical protein